MFAERPDNPEMRESVSVWVCDDRGAIGLPRIGIEAVADQWDTHGIQINVAFPDGRVFRLREDGQPLAGGGPDGRADGPRRRSAVVRAGRAVRAPGG